MKGLFIAFEGPEGGGKTTQAKLLVDRLRNLGFEVLHVREPGGTPVGEKIRDVLKDPILKIPAYSELFLFFAARNALVETVIRPELKAGTIVVTDRFDLSTMAYQISGRRLPEHDVIAANDSAKNGVEPDIYFVCLVDAKTGLARKGDPVKLDRIEKEDADFHKRVLEGYMKFGQGEESFFIDTTKYSIEEVQKIVWSELQRRFPETFSQAK